MEIKFESQVLEDGHLSIPAPVKKKLKLEKGSKLSLIAKKLGEIKAGRTNRSKDNPLCRVIGLGRSGKDNLSEEHDKYLYQNGEE